ncbi:MAG: PAS domain S-box protein [Desulfarculaceae bacterium]|nr:PAS domain S-box protein [Desulfarculaceae bacterium]
MQKQPSYEELCNSVKYLEDQLEVAQSLMTNSPDSINLHRYSDGTYLDINQSFTDLTGYGREEVLGKSTLEINIWKDPADRDRFLNELRKSGEVKNFEVQFKKKTGEIATGLISASVLSVKGEQVILSVTRDITARKRAEETLKESEKKFHTVFQKSAIGRTINSIDGTFVDVNHAFCEIIGFPREEILSRTWMDFVHQAYHDKIHKAVKALVDGERDSFTNELKANHKNKKSIWARVNGVVLRDENGFPKFLFADVEDITDRKTAEFELRKNEEQLRLIADNMVDVISRTDAENHFVYASSSAERAFGYSPEELLGTPATDMIHPDDIDPFLAKMAEARQKNDASVLLQCRLRHANGGFIWVEAATRLLYDKTGQSAGAIFCTRDITDRVNAEIYREKLESQLAEAQKLEAIGTLSGGIAHDFNNILSGIFGYSHLAKMHIDEPEKAKSHIGNIQTGARRAADLIQQILTFSRKDESEKQITQLYLLLKETLKLLRSTIPPTIEIKEIINSKASVLADPTQMHQLIMNLCTNAYHAMKETGGILTVKLEDSAIYGSNFWPVPANASEPYLRLEVGDTGHGIDKKDIGRIFNPYFTTKRQEEGTGLGLALAHAIVKEHRGYITAESTVGQGTSFVVHLPVTDRQGTESEESRNVAPVAPGTESIMLVEDEEAIRSAISSISEDYGYRLTAFEDGLKAYEAFQKAPYEFDLVVTDMTMPGMTGANLAEEILRIRNDIPIILCTGYSEKMNENEAEKIGVSKYLQKPVDTEHLFSIVRELLDS